MERIFSSQTDTLNKHSLDIWRKFQDINENLSATKNKVETAIIVNPDKKRQQKGVTEISENPSISSRANVSEEGKSCDSISSNDKFEANVRSYYAKNTIKRISFKLQQVSGPSHSNESKVRKLNRNIHKVGRKVSLVLYSRSDLDDNVQQYINSISDKVEIEGYAITSDDNEFMNNISNNLTTLENTGEHIAF